MLEHRSKVLAENPLGDPHVRRLAVWLPPQYDRRSRGPGARFPVLVDMVGFTGSGPAHLNWKPFSENLAERAARLIHEKRMGPVILVMPDCFTSLGGNQYVNSSAVGRYADYLVDEIVPYVDREFRTLASREHRGCFGKSSGGYGAIIHGMRYTRHWGAIADHSGDAYFEFIYHCDWPNTLNVLAKYRQPARRAGRQTPTEVARGDRRLMQGFDDGRAKRFLDAMWGKPKLSHAEGMAIMNVCMAATYDPDPKAPLGFRFPFHLETRRGRAGPLAALDAPRPRQPGRAVPPESSAAARDLHRLRLARPVPHPLRDADPLEAPHARPESRTATRSSTMTTPMSTIAWT